METSTWEGSPDDSLSDVMVTEVPSVVAVVVTSDPDERFDAALASLAAQDYPSLTVLVVDAGSSDDLSPRIGARVPDAFIRRLPERVGFAAAANEALAAVEGANYLLFCTDDVVVGEDAVSILVEEAVRSNAGIVGPKYVDDERTTRLLQIGLSADKLGVPFSPVDPGEVDHEQHDAVRDMFAVPHAAMLVRADLLAELGGFDAGFSSGVEEVDLCWRARLAGARVLVAPDAVVRRPASALEDRFGLDPDAARADEPRNRLTMLLRNYSALSLLRVLPQAAIVSAFQAVALAFMGRGGRAWSVVSAWLWNLRHLPGVLSRRRSIQRLRAVPDSDVRSLQIRGFAYLRAFLSGRLHLGTRVETLGGASRDLAGSVRGSVRRPNLVFGAVVTAVAVVGARDLITGGLPAVGTFVPWPDAGDLFRDYGSSWRFVGAGSSGPAPPLLVVLGAFGSLVFGSEALARTLVVAAAIPLGAYGAFRLMLPLAQSVWPPLAAAATYAVVPLPRNAIVGGRLGALVFYAVAPFLVERILRASGVSPFGDSAGPEPNRNRRRALYSLAVLTALTATVIPIAVALVPLAALLVFAASPLAGDRVAAVRGLVTSLVAAGIALALLFPWSVGLLLPTPDLDVLGLVFRDRLSFPEALAFDSGPARVGVSGLLLAVAAQPLMIGSGERLRWASRAWALALGGFLAAWLPARLDLGVGLPPAEAPLSLAAVGVAMAVGLGSGILREDLQRTGLSWRQGVAVLSLGALAVVTLPLFADALHGRWHLPGRDWHGALAWMESEQRDGGFRVLWIGDPAVLPAGAVTLDDGTGFAITRDGPGDARSLHQPAVEGPTRRIAEAVEAAVDGRTDRLGHLLGPYAVRYVAFPTERAPGLADDEQAPEEQAASADPGVPPLSIALSRQIDLAELVTDPGIRLYENRAWMPSAALVSADTAETVREAGARDAIRIDLSGARPVDPPGGPEVSVPEGQRDVVEGVLVLSEPFNTDWEGVADGALRPHFRVFGSINGFDVEDVDRIDVELEGRGLRYGALGVEAVIWMLVVGAWLRHRAAERAARRAWDSSLRDVRPIDRRPAEAGAR